jgi:hypothetical protein
MLYGDPTTPPEEEYLHYKERILDTEIRKINDEMLLSKDKELDIKLSKQYPNRIKWAHLK